MPCRILNKKMNNKNKFIHFLLTLILGGGVGISGIFALAIPFAENKSMFSLFVLAFPVLSLIYFIYLLRSNTKNIGSLFAHIGVFIASIIFIPWIILFLTS
ncbi:hypothetical protein V6S04_10565 [Bacillus sp. CCNWLW147]|uniref:hypothetical protein n=2 Tax=Bacillaceae TaxID=186817 RepID=UPI000BF7A264|nr:hypothetical protein [Bacillus cereus]PES55478.1 hypothetical protein CN515_05390 [Bacillus cereus]